MEARANKNYYEILNVAKDATKVQIKAALKKLYLRYHSDKAQGEDRAIAEETTKLLNEIKETLTDDHKRKTYDSSLNNESDQNFASEFYQFGSLSERIARFMAECDAREKMLQAVISNFDVFVKTREKELESTDLSLLKMSWKNLNDISYELSREKNKAANQSKFEVIEKLVKSYQERLIFLTRVAVLTLQDKIDEYLLHLKETDLNAQSIYGHMELRTSSYQYPFEISIFANEFGARSNEQLKLDFLRDAMRRSPLANVLEIRTPLIPFGFSIQVNVKVEYCVDFQPKKEAPLLLTGSSSSSSTQMTTSSSVLSLLFSAPASSSTPTLGDAEKIAAYRAKYPFSSKKKRDERVLTLYHEEQTAKEFKNQTWNYLIERSAGPKYNGFIFNLFSQSLPLQPLYEMCINSREEKGAAAQFLIDIMAKRKIARFDYDVSEEDQRMLNILREGDLKNIAEKALSFAKKRDSFLSIFDDMDDDFDNDIEISNTISMRSGKK